MSDWKANGVVCFRYRRGKRFGGRGGSWDEDWGREMTSGERRYVQNTVACLPRAALSFIKSPKHRSLFHSYFFFYLFFFFVFISLTRTHIFPLALSVLEACNLYISRFFFFATVQKVRPLLTSRGARAQRGSGRARRRFESIQRCRVHC